MLEDKCSNEVAMAPEAYRTTTRTASQRRDADPHSASNQGQRAAQKRLQRTYGGINRLPCVAVLDRFQSDRCDPRRCLSGWRHGAALETGSVPA